MDRLLFYLLMALVVLAPDSLLAAAHAEAILQFMKLLHEAGHPRVRVGQPSRGEVSRFLLRGHT